MASRQTFPRRSQAAGGPASSRTRRPGRSERSAAATALYGERCSMVSRVRGRNGDPSDDYMIPASRPAAMTTFTSVNDRQDSRASRERSASGREPVVLLHLRDDLRIGQLVRGFDGHNALRQRLGAAQTLPELQLGLTRPEEQKGLGLPQLTDYLVVVLREAAGGSVPRISSRLPRPRPPLAPGTLRDLNSGSAVRPWIPGFGW